MADDSTERLLKNYSGARRSYEAWCFLVSLGNTDSSIRDIVDNNQLLYHLRYLTLKDYYIEIYKVIKDSNKNADNIFKALRRFKELYPDKEQVIDTILTELKQPETGVKETTDLRDKFYAHLDHDYKEYLNSPSLEHMYKIFDLIDQSLLIIVGKERLQKQLDFILKSKDYYLPNYP